MAGYQLVGHTDPRAGVAAALADRPDLVITILVMPDWTAWQVICRLRRVSAVPILLHTGHGRAPECRRHQRMCVDEFLEKPFTRTQLLTGVDGLLRDRAAPA